MRNSLLILIFAFLISACETGSKKVAMGSQNQLPDSVDYNIHIKPILSDRCFACHGPDKNAMKAGLALYHAEGAYAELKEDSGHYAIIPGNVKESMVVQRISSTDPELMMPPPESNLSLNDFEKKLITKWIEQGAVYKPHWSFIAVDKPQLPRVKDSSWVRNPIDHFILAKMESMGLSPEPKASKEKLIRRLSFDITGLPPTLDEIDEFLADDSENAYEKVVDRLLNSKAYAERMTGRWLDISRYADSHGYQVDFYRSMWPWRDWVINAYDENKPFDEFLTEQLAGDLLPNATYDQILATGFNRNHNINQEGGIISEEFRVEYVADRTNTLGEAVLGLTVECARCHDHKYDPLSQREYYQLYGFFNSVPEQGYMGGPAPGPSVKYPAEKLEKHREYLINVENEQINSLKIRKATVAGNPRSIPTFEKWISDNSSQYKEIEQPQARAYYSMNLFDSSILIHPTDKKNTQLKDEIVEPKGGKFSGGLFIQNGYYYELEKHPFINHADPFSISFWFYKTYYLSRNVLYSKIDPKTGKGILIGSDFKNIYVQFKSSQTEVAVTLMSEREIKDLEWVHLAITYDGSGVSNGIKLYANGDLIPLSGDKTIEIPFIKPESPSILAPNGLSNSGMDELYFYDYSLEGTSINVLKNYNPIHQALAVTFEKLDSQRQNEIVEHYLFHEDREYGIILRNLESVRYKYLDIPKKGDLSVMTMADLPEPRPTFILQRGAYDAPTEEVKPGAPSAVLQVEDSLPSNRLGLSKWLFHPDNPLTSRVAVNRYWQYIFGKGIVKTLEDFGNQGDLPTHPELLDWLASNFMENGWDIKAQLKLMLMSNTYQQASTTSQEKRKFDPENKYYSRGQRYRLPIEMIRDQALAVSGLLNPKIGGPGVRPYQPEHLWRSVTAVGGGPLASYVLDITDDLYRRSLYTFWKRTVPPPAMLTFDAATRDRCIVRTESTNTPLQALVLLNDPQYVEAARVTAQNIMVDKNRVEENITVAFRKFTGRFPAEEELKRFMQLYKKSYDNFEQKPDLADKLIYIGEYETDKSLEKVDLAAHTVVISTILNLDEAISKE